MKSCKILFFIEMKITLQVVSYRLQDGGSEYIQLLDLGCSIMKAYALK